MADLVHDGEQCLNALFDHGLVTEACGQFELPGHGLFVVFAAGCFTLGTLHAGAPGSGAGASLSMLFAAPDLGQVARLRDAALQLEHGA